jgi:hypothetical protein
MVGSLLPPTVAPRQPSTNRTRERAPDEKGRTCLVLVSTLAGASRVLRKSIGVDEVFLVLNLCSDLLRSTLQWATHRRCITYVGGYPGNYG